MTPDRASVSDSLAGEPLVSVIIPTFNRGPFLERCVRSVLDQTYPRLECLVMDGASKDDSVAILTRLAAADPRLRFVSEPDRGEVDAVNKGLDLVRGDLVGIQASDDFYVPDALEHAVRFLCAHPEFIGVAGDARYVDAQGNDLGRGVVTYRGEMSKATIRHVLRVRFKSCMVCHGSFFGWRERLRRHGKFDPEFSFTPDWEYYLRLLAADESIGCLPRVQYKYTIHEGMGAAVHSRKAEDQRRVFHQRHGMTAVDEFYRATLGRACSYFANPYRSPLISGLARELLTACRRS